MGKQTNHIIRVPPPKQAQILHNVDPKEIFTGLEEIGRGSFGSVYEATKEGVRVAIKIIGFKKGFGSDEWADIYKELEFLSSIEHENIIEYQGSYLDDLSVWIAMEYAIGSVQDVMDVFKDSLAEVEIVAIVHSVLQALSYLHSSGKIHRDIKAGNILLKEDGTVKLGDFGSASNGAIANSLIGTPYWMAPELIMAMETGTYGVSADVWSLGITCIELGQRKPPLFQLNAMTALYHIPQKEPPAFDEPDKWTTNLVNFVGKCLRKDPTDRPTAETLLTDTLMTSSERDGVLFRLVERTKCAEVQEVNALSKERVLQKTRSMIELVESQEPTANSARLDRNKNKDEKDEQQQHQQQQHQQQHQQHNAQDNDEEGGGGGGGFAAATAVAAKIPTTVDLSESVVDVEDDDDGDDNNDDDDDGDGGDDDGDDVDMLSTQSSDVDSDVTSSKSQPHSNSTHNITEELGDLNIEEGSNKNSGRFETPLQLARKHRYEDEQHSEKSIVILQLREIQNMRKEMSKQMDSVTSKHQNEISKVQTKMVQEIDSLRKTKEKDLEKHLAKCRAEREQNEKAQALEERKFLKRRKDYAVKLWNTFKRNSEIEYKKALDVMKLDVIADSTKEDRRQQKEQMKDQHNNHRRLAESKQKERLRMEDNIARIESSLSRLPMQHALNFRHLQQEVEIVMRYNNDMAAARESNTMTTLTKEHLTEQEAISFVHLAKLDETEMEQAQRMQRHESKLTKKRHNLELKSQPKELKQSEQKIKRHYTDTVKVTEKKFKSVARSLSSTASVSKLEYESSLKKHKDQRTTTISKLETAYRGKLVKMIEDMTSSTAKKQLRQVTELERHHMQDNAKLKEYQLLRNSKHTTRLNEKLQTAERASKESAQELTKLKAKLDTENKVQKARSVALSEVQTEETIEMQKILSHARACSF